MQAIIPNHMLRGIALSGVAPAPAKKAAIASLSLSGKHRERRSLLADVARRRPQPVSGLKTRYVYDAEGTERLPGQLMRREGQAPVADKDANTAYDTAGVVYDFYKQAFGRNSINNAGMPLVSIYNYGVNFDNAFWDGQMMIYGGGDGHIFMPFLSVIDIPGHEISHGVTQYTSNLNYEGQPGALNESFSDCMGSCIKQFSLKQTADQADWLIGQGIFTSLINGRALRDMLNPGTAYDDPNLGGKDPQPAHMDDYVNTWEDEGGVHLNSGIPNKAFATACKAMGGFSWEKIGAIWYQTNLTVNAYCRFQQWAATTANLAQRFGPAAVNVIRMAWSDVGINV